MKKEQPRFVTAAGVTIQAIGSADKPTSYKVTDQWGYAVLFSPDGRQGRNPQTEDELASLVDLTGLREIAA